MIKKQLTIMMCVAVVLSGCAVGPNYIRPEIDVGTYFKEAPTGWKFANPKDHIDRGQWWRVWQDEPLNRLVEQVKPANLTVAQALANYRQARAQVQTTKADFYPNVDLKGGTNRNKGSSDTTKTISLDAGWELDFWGKTARSVEAASANAQAQESALKVAQLSQEAELVQNYFALRIVDKRKYLAEQTAKLYQKTLTITQNQYKAGIVSKADVASAEAQLKSAQVQIIDLDLSRKQYEHAIAILIGKAPAQFSIKPNLNWQPYIASIPSVVPSDLLERRPDIAQAERNVMAANAKIGVAKAAFYPSLKLSASTGYGAVHIGELFNSPARVWSVGASLMENLFDGGGKRADVKIAEANYDASVAGYKLAVLGALQEVEDNLAATDLLAEQKKLQTQANKAAQESARIALNQYKAGTTTFVTVASAQASQFSLEQSLWQLVGRELSAQTLLVKSLGGGWLEENDNE